MSIMLSIGDTTFQFKLVFWQHKIKELFWKSHLFSGGREMSRQQLLGTLLEKLAH